MSAPPPSIASAGVPVCTSGTSIGSSIPASAFTHACRAVGFHTRYKHIHGQQLFARRRAALSVGCLFARCHVHFGPRALNVLARAGPTAVCTAWACCADSCRDLFTCKLTPFDRRRRWLARALACRNETTCRCVASARGSYSGSERMASRLYYHVGCTHILHCAVSLSALSIESSLTFSTVMAATPSLRSGS